jgi:hypothetical protein
MAVDKIQVIQNDNNHKLIFTIKKDNRIESIFGAIVQLQFVNRENGHIMKRECTITDPDVAECMYILTSEDLSETGSYATEVTVIYSNGTRLTHQNPFTLVVIPEIVVG